AHRVVLQVDQGAPAHQSLLWHIGECSEDSAVACGVGLCAHCYRQKAARSARFALRIATDFEPHHVRKNPVATTAYILRAPESIALLFQSTVFVQLTLGHLCLEGGGIFFDALFTCHLFVRHLSLMSPSLVSCAFVTRQLCARHLYARHSSLMSPSLVTCEPVTFHLCARHSSLVCGHCRSSFVACSR